MKKLDSGESIYNAKWQRRRRIFLLNNPLCRYCEEHGAVEAATVVDHIEPHRGNAELFWDEANWQGLCKVHHDSTKQSAEKRGFSCAVGLDGWPVDAAHPVNDASHVHHRGKKGTYKGKGMGGVVKK